MQSILQLLNKIKWDKRENPDDYILFYYDRIDNSKKQISYNEIKRREGSFLIIERDNDELNIPLHRIREVRKKGRLVWRR
jgi:uncharacterized protein (UPF0248 family)